MKRKAEEEPEIRIYKRAKVSDLTAHYLWQISIFHQLTMHQVQLINAYNDLKKALITSSGFRCSTPQEVTELVKLLKINGALSDEQRQKYKYVKSLIDTCTGAEQTLKAIRSLGGTQVVTDTIYNIIQVDLTLTSFTPTHIPPLMQQAIMIIENAIKEFYTTILARHNSFQTFEQILTAHNQDQGGSIFAILQIAGRLTQNSTISQDQYNHLHTLVTGRNGALCALETESYATDNIEEK